MKAARKKHFNPSFIYIMLFAFNFVDFVVFDYLMLSSTSSLVPRLVLESVQVAVGALLLLAGTYYVFDRTQFFNDWRLRAMYTGYSLHYCAVSVLGHLLMLSNVAVLQVLGPSFLTTGIFDGMVIVLSFAILIASIGVYEPRSKELLPTVATQTHPSGLSSPTPSSTFHTPTYGGASSWT
jgi:hypothetical protein